MSGLGNKRVMAKNIKYYLQLNNLTQTDLCSTLGFKMSTVSDWLHARTYPRIDKIELMANYFGISKSDLVEEKKNVQSVKQQPKILEYYDQLNDLGKHEAEKRVSELTYISKYTTNSSLRAAHNDFADNDEEIEKIRRDFDKF